MQLKITNLLLILTSLLGYLEWGEHNHAFLFQAEAEIVMKLFTSPTSMLHPFTVLPMAGQLLLVFTLFQKMPSKGLTYVGLGCLGMLLGLMLAIGLMGFQYKIIISTLPFFVVSFFAIRELRKKVGQAAKNM